ncbi:MAG: alpha-L-fucosidase, partial [Lentisphaerae bacterium]|nr:alpha-L-fucosidase [Lentisphaerota bacterium]
MESKKVIEDRIRRMKWWNQARYGMFIHWGLYSILGRHEWVMNRERIPLEEYDKLADKWKPTPNAAREWAALAKEAGMKYVVMTTKHHEGFCLWDSKLTDFCATKRGPGRDLVKEFVDACREFDLKIGFYYSLMDWHHPDGHACARDENARRRFIDYTYGLVEELMTNYGKIDILWYDVSWPLVGADKWESKRISGMARKHQPDIIINNRAQLPEDFGTPEETIVREEVTNGRGWEACMTFNGAWGDVNTPDEDWHGARKVLGMINQCTALGGNLLLNIG